MTGGRSSFFVAFRTRAGGSYGECGLWNRWVWNGTGLVLLEEAARKTCDGTEPDLSNWSSTWPPKNASN